MTTFQYEYFLLSSLIELNSKFRTDYPSFLYDLMSKIHTKEEQNERSKYLENMTLISKGLFEKHKQIIESTDNNPDIAFEPVTEEFLYCSKWQRQVA
jgi:hypothetical protein